MIKFATIWRVEMKGGTGMYSPGGLGAIVREEGIDSEGPQHPTPPYDTQLNWPGTKYQFGFASLAQFRQWVYKPRWRRRLHDGDFLLVKYRVPVRYFRRSQYQACFVRRVAKRIETRRVDYLDKLKGA